MAPKSFEQAKERLERIVQDLERGELPLEESLKAFEEGMKLVTFCSGKLDEAERKVSLLVRDKEGGQRLVPFPAGEEEGNA